MHIIRAAVLAAARQRVARARGRGDTSPRPGPGLTRLLLEEIGWALRQAIHPVTMTVGLLVAVGTVVGLGPTTPGPVLEGGFRLGVSAALGTLGLAVAHRMLQRRPGAPDVVDNLRVILGAVAALLGGTVVLAHVLALVTGSTPGAVEHPIAVSLPVDLPLLGGAALLAVAVIAAALGDRVSVPASLLFLGLGMVIGSEGLGWIQLDDPQLVQSLSVVALVVILFDGGLGTDRHHLRLGSGPGLALATIGVATTAGLTAVGTMVLLDVPSRLAWLLGAIVASTDAAAVFALLRRAPVAARLSSTLRIESGVNDPVAVLLTVGLLSAWDAPPSPGAWLSFGAQQMIGGVVVGVVVGWIGAAALRRISLGGVGLYPILALAVGGLAYGAAVAAGASGFLATYLAGVVVAAEAPRYRGTVRSFLGALSGGVEVGLFLLLGLLVFPSQLWAVAWTSLGVTAVLLLIARPVGTWLSLVWFDHSWREIVATSWLGMRGAVPIVLATLAFSAGIPEAALIFNVVFFVVLTSALLQGTTAVPLVRRLGLERTVSATRTVVEALPLETVDVDILEVALSADSRLVGRRLVDCQPPDDVVLAAIVRGRAVLVPRGGTHLAADDRLVITTTDLDNGIAVVEAWLGQDASGAAVDPSDDVVVDTPDPARA